MFQELQKKALKIFSSTVETLKGILKKRTNLNSDLIGTLHDLIYAIQEYKMLPDQAIIPHPVSVLK